MSDQARLEAALSLSQHGAVTVKDVQNVLGPLEGAQETSEKLDRTLQAYGRLERSCAAKGRRIAELESEVSLYLSALERARSLLGTAKCGDPECEGCRADYELAWDVLHAALKGKGLNDG